jgi:hypothetical protein
MATAVFADALENQYGLSPKAEVMCYYRHCRLLRHHHDHNNNTFF